MTTCFPATEPCETHPPPEDDPGELLQSVERLMAQLAGGEGADIAGRLVLEQLGTGGKRARAQLALEVCRACGVSASEAVSWAAAVELLHNATLVHDDIQDGDRTRRGRPTLWAAHGLAQALNAGDLMLMLPFLALARLGADRRLSGVLAQAAVEAARGQAQELALLAEHRFDRASYEATARAKTGALLALPVQGAAILAGATEQRVTALGSVFRTVGLVYQLQDDVIDLFGDKGRQHSGGDIYEGKVSALVVAQLEDAPCTRDELLSILRTPREQTTHDQVERARKLFLGSGALGRVNARIRELEATVLDAPVLREDSALHAVAQRMLDQFLGRASGRLPRTPGE